MERLRLAGKLAVVIGAAGGIGSAAALTLGNRGCNLCLSDVASLLEVKNKCYKAGLTDKQVCTVSGDITKPEVRKQVVDEALQQFGKIDILVYTVGILNLDDLATLTEEGLSKTMSVNLHAFIFLTQLCIPHLIQTKGNIVAVSSTGASTPRPQFLSYNLSKAGMDMFIKYTAHELASTGVRVNAVRPGLIETPMAFINAHQFVAEGTDKEEYLAERGKGIALGQVGQPEELAEVIAFLASDAASYMTGEFVNVNGGGGSLGFQSTHPDFGTWKQ